VNTWVSSDDLEAVSKTHQHLEVDGMRRLIVLSAVAVLAVVLLACNSSEKQSNLKSTSGKPVSTTAPTTSSDGVRRITTVELRDALEKGTAVIVDVRATASYEQNHIKGALHIPLEDFPRRIGELPQGKMIVTYCS
jgi:3-mercaptopyruvate sulfurtransferase SseA